MSRFRIVQRLPRQQLTAEQLLGPTEIRFGKSQVRLALPNRRACNLERGIRLLHLLEDLAVLYLCDALTARDSVAELHVYVFEASSSFRYHCNGLFTNKI